MDISENIRKLVMAGIGAVSVAAEKSQELLEQLAEKGEQAVNDGKVINEQLRHEVKQAFKEHVTVVEEKPVDKESVLAALKSMTAEERDALLREIAPQSQEEAADDK